ncbi:hypothetical protein CRG98_021186 [Punica granatum]|uniref:Aminotransferase-like plant mobile domain-containing protein n=1 Tax=Punica granatum TaxID=22663 RepID=A0A2I0JQ52_PUNGR|nr:hypothetical protein CRG98_021186 [Punica granatum]
MDYLHPCLRVDVIITPAADITYLWSTFRLVDRAFLQLIIRDLPLLADSPIDWTLLRTALSFWDTQRAVFDFQGTELAPTVEEYAALIQQPMPTRDIVGFLLLIFGTILFQYSSNLIDEALAQVILQVVGGHGYVEAVLAKTIQYLDYVREGAHSSFQAESSDNLVAYRVFLQRQIALHTSSCRQTQQLYFQTGFYESRKFDVYGARVSFSSFTSRNIPLMRSELSQLLQHMWLNSIHRDSHLFVGFAWHRFRGHRTQTFLMQRALPKEPCARSCSPLGKSEIDPTESLSRHVQNSRIRESCRESKRRRPISTKPTQELEWLRKFGTLFPRRISRQPRPISRRPQCDKATFPQAPHHPPNQRPIVDPIPWALPNLTLESRVVPTSIAHVPAVHPVNISLVPPAIPMAASFPQMAPSASRPTLFMPPRVSMLATAPIYIVPPPMMFPASSTLASAYTVEPFPFQTPQPHISFPYQAPPPRSTLVPESDAPIQVALVTPPTDFYSEAETEHERRLKKMEEAINDLQAGDSRLKFGDNNWNLVPDSTVQTSGSKSSSTGAMGPAYARSRRWCDKTPITFLWMERLGRKSLAQTSTRVLGIKTFTVNTIVVPQDTPPTIATMNTCC